MARVTITPQELSARNAFKTPAAFTALTTAIDGTDGAEIVWKERDDKYLLFVQNVAGSGADKTVTIKAGNGIQGVNDLAITSLGYGEYTIVAIDSGRFKNVSGTDKGKVVITGTDANIKVACFKLP